MTASKSFSAGLAEVAAALGAPVAEALKRAVLRDCADEAEHPDSGVLRRAGRFAWFEASGPFFGKNRYAVERGEVSWLPTPVYRDELRGASSLLARYTPLSVSDASALIVVLDAFGDGKIHFMRDERSRYVARGVFAAETHNGDDEDDEFARRGRVEVELATGTVTVVSASADANASASASASASANANAAAKSSDSGENDTADAMLRDEALRAMLVSAHKSSRRGGTPLGSASEYDLEDPTHVDAHPPIAAQKAAREASSNDSSLDDVTEVTDTDVDKTRRS